MVNVTFPCIQYVPKKAVSSFLLQPIDNRSLKARVCDFFKSFKHHKLMVEAYGRRAMHYHSPQKRAEYMSLENARYPVEKMPWHNEKHSDGLCVFVHGFKGAAYCWDEYAEDIQQLNRKKGKQVHCFIPLVLRGGDCTLEEGATPILTAIHEYAKKYPAKPIHLIGASNGAKIIGYLDRMIKLENTEVKVVSIVGVHFGSKLLDYVPVFIQKRYLFSEKVRQDFKYGSKVNQARLKSWRDFAKENDKQTGRTRFFFAATADTKVQNTASALPVIGEKDEHYIVHGHSHESVTDGIRHFVLTKLKIA